MRKAKVLGFVALIGLGLHAHGSFSSASCWRKTPERIGRALARPFLRQAKYFAELNVRADDCVVGPGSNASKSETKRLEALEDRIDTAIERMNVALDEGCLEEVGPYEGSAGFFLFRSLAGGLSSENPLVRWNILERMRWLCDGRELLPDSADAACKSEVEAAAIGALSTDVDSENRRHALKILAAGYATLDSQPLLERLSVNAADEDERAMAASLLQQLRSAQQ